MDRWVGGQVDRCNKWSEGCVPSDCEYTWWGALRAISRLPTMAESLGLKFASYQDGDRDESHGLSCAIKAGVQLLNLTLALSKTPSQEQLPWSSQSLLERVWTGSLSPESGSPR